MALLGGLNRKDKAMIKAPLQELIDAEFVGTRFGPEGETPNGRVALVAGCIMQRACGYSAGGTITNICKRMNMLTPNLTPRLWAKKWAFQVTMGSMKPNPNFQAGGTL